MGFPLTEDMFKTMFPKAKSPTTLYKAMVKILPKYDIDTPQRIAAFLAQCGHESGGFRVRTENLNYSAKALDSVFGKYFKRAGRDAKEYARKPEKIANIVYANRMGNGDTESGDGYRFRGRGYIQLTGKNNYRSFAKSLDMGPEEVIKYLETIDGALESACWFWSENGLNRYADENDMKTLTKRINGGYNGLEDRMHHWEVAMKYLGGDVMVSKPKKDKSEGFHRTLQIGSKGDDVAMLQRKLGLAADGVFGRGTRQAVKRFQMSKGLKPDGIAGKKTLSLL